MIEVHLKFYTLMFIYVVFLEGAAWTAEGLCSKNPIMKQRPEMLCNHTEGLILSTLLTIGLWAETLMRCDSSVLCWSEV